MEQALIQASSRGRLVACPDCGAAFVPRGIAAHRRMKHGVREARNGNGAAEAKSLENVLLPALERLTSLLARIDARLAALERKTSPSSPGDEAVALEAHLSGVIEEIDRVKAESSRLASTWKDRPLTEEQRALEETTYLHLGLLRRQQARLLFDLQDLKGNRETRIDCIL